jgi:hypothetical protein
MTYMAGNLCIRVYSDFFDLRSYHLTAQVYASNGSSREQRVTNFLNWIIFGTYFYIAVHANRGRNDRNGRDSTDKQTTDYRQILFSYHIFLDWIIFGTGFDIALQANLISLTRKNVIIAT